MKLFKQIKNICNSIILCIRFPFLYPRNRFDDCHHRNYKFSAYIGSLYNKSVNLVFYETPIIVNGEERRMEKKILNKPLYCLYKFLKFVYHYPYQLLYCIPTYTELNAMDKGWRKTFGIQMCKDIRKALLEEGGIKALFNYRILQIKEKWGGLRWYDSYSTNKIQEIISQYEVISMHTCINCGKPAKYMTTGWICPYCEDCIQGEEGVHYKKIEKMFVEY